MFFTAVSDGADIGVGLAAAEEVSAVARNGLVALSLL